MQASRKQLSAIKYLIGISVMFAQEIIANQDTTLSATSKTIQTNIAAVQHSKKW